jgi:hypothetical protein
MNILRTMKRRKANRIGHILRRNCRVNTLLKEGWREGYVTGRRGGRSKHGEEEYFTYSKKKKD